MIASPLQCIQTETTGVYESYNLTASNGSRSSEFKLFFCELDKSSVLATFFNGTNGTNGTWYYKKNPIHRGNTGKLSRRSFRAMKRVSPYPQIKYTATFHEAHKKLFLHQESRTKTLTQELMRALSVDPVDWSKAMRLLREGGDPFAYKGDSFRPNILFKVIIDITNRSPNEVKKPVESQERVKFIAMLLEREGIESALLQFDSTLFRNTPFTAAIAARDKSASNAIFNHLKKTNHELLITPNQNILESYFGNNTPLILAIKTNNEELAINLVLFYTAELLRKPITWAASNVLELAHLARFNRLLPVMADAAQGFTVDEAKHLQSLYDTETRGNDVWSDLYESDMFLNDDGEFIEDKERISDYQAYHTSMFIRSQ